MMQTRTLALGLSTLLLLAACSEQPVPRVLAPLPALPTMTVPPPDTASERRWDGVVQAVQNSDLSAQTSARVLSVAVDVNDSVAAAEVLLTLSAVEQGAQVASAEARLRAAQAAANEAQATYVRYTALGKKQLVSQLLLDQVRSTRDAAVAARDAAAAQRADAIQQREYTVVRAPFAGVVRARHVEPGESVVPGQPLLALYAPSAMRIEVQLPQSEAAAVRGAAKASVILADGQRVQAAKVIVFPAADPASHAVAVRIELPQLQRPPLPGTTAQVLFPSATAPILRLPEEAIVQRGELSGVYVLADARLTLRQLRLGARDGAQVEVLAGLVGNEVIVTNPVAALQALRAQRAAAGTAND